VIVYVETNFLLELARRQGEEAAAEAILQLAEGKRIKLVVPSSSFFEPIPALDRHASARNLFVQQFNNQVRELGRLQPHRELASKLKSVAQVFLSLERTEMDRLAGAILRTLAIAETIPLTPSLFAQARQCQDKFELSLQDAIIFASICYHAFEHPAEIQKCFINRNSNDFGESDTKDILKQANCMYFASFNHGLQHIQRTVQPT
jgi:predicted nucleic acid-binding protein